MSPQFLDALLSGRHFIAEGIGGFALPNGWPDDRDTRFLILRLQQMREEAQSQAWLMRAMVLPQALRPMVGHIGFHGPPQDGAVELGYTVLPRHRRQGYAFESAHAMMQWATAEGGVRRFILSIATDNEASMALARRMGFTPTGEQTEAEEGLQQRYELIVADSSA